MYWMDLRFEILYVRSYEHYFIRNNEDIVAKYTGTENVWEKKT